MGPALWRGAAMILAAAARQSLRERARCALLRPVPDFIRDGSADQARAYKECAAKAASFVRTGHDVKRAATVVARLESMQGVPR